MAGPLRRSLVTQPYWARRPPAVAWMAALAAMLVFSALFPGITARAAPARGVVASLGCANVTQPVIVTGTTPVLFVHGIDSDHTVWTQGSVGLTLKSPLDYVDSALGTRQEVTGYTFDWANYSGLKSGSKLAWMTGPPAPGPGPLLAQAIKCVAQKSGHKVIIIAHSMGGLLTEYASKSTADDISAVFTLGTPFYGSWLDSLAVGPLLPASQSIAAACAFGASRAGAPGEKKRAKTNGAISNATISSGLESLCRVVGQAKDPGMVAMLTSANKKTGWPALKAKGSSNGLKVYPLAASIQVTWQPFPGLLRPAPLDLGDGVVSTSSELNGGTKPTITCTVPATSTPDVLSVIDLLAASTCLHTNEPDNQTLLDGIITTIKQQHLIPTSALIPVDWNNRYYDLTCGNTVQAPVSVAFSGGKATARGPGIGSYDQWDMSIDQVVQGALPSVGRVTAVLSSCSPSPSNFSVQELRIYHTADGSEVGRIPALSANGGALPGVYTAGSVAIGNGHVSADVMFYGPGDSHASGPSVPGHLTWSWNGQKFITDAAPAAICPDSTQLLSIWNSAPATLRQSWASPQVTGFADITCWHSWVVAMPIAVSSGNGLVVFSQTGSLRLITVAELQQQFSKEVCSAPDAPSGWKSPPLISCN